MHAHSEQALRPLFAPPRGDDFRGQRLGGADRHRQFAGYQGAIGHGANLLSPLCGYRRGYAYGPRYYYGRPAYGYGYGYGYYPYAYPVAPVPLPVPFFGW